MQADDIFVEVRNRTLNRQGIITADYLDLEAVLRPRDVGEWSLKLPGDHPMVPRLSEEGSGIIVYQRKPGTGAHEVLWSGPTSVPTVERNATNPDGTYTFEGVTDTEILLGARAFPSPGIADAQASSQDRSHDIRTGNAETLMRSYVGYNITRQWAPIERTRGFREYLSLEASNGNRGPTMRKAPRFQILLELLQEIAVAANLNFDVVQIGVGLVFRVISPRNVYTDVVLSMDEGTIVSESVSMTRVSVTRAIVAGQGEGKARRIVTRSNEVNDFYEYQSGRVVETFIDQRQTEDVQELIQAGDEQLLEGAAGSVLKVVPSDSVDNPVAQFGSWREGDTIGVRVNGRTHLQTVTEARIIINGGFVGVGVGIGNVTSTDRESALEAKVTKVEQRVEAIERTDFATEAELLTRHAARLAPAPVYIGSQSLNSLSGSGSYWGDYLGSAPEASIAEFWIEHMDDGANPRYASQRAIERDTGKEWTRYQRAGAWSAWKQAGGAVEPVVNGTATRGTNWTINAANTIQRQGKLVVLGLSADKATFSAFETVMTLEAAFRPTATVDGSSTIGTGSIAMRVLTDGRVVTSASGVTGIRAPFLYFLP
jgi:hypothetical protein